MMNNDDEDDHPYLSSVFRTSSNIAYRSATVPPSSRMRLVCVPVLLLLAAPSARPAPSDLARGYLPPPPAEVPPPPPPPPADPPACELVTEEVEEEVTVEECSAVDTETCDTGTWG